MIEISTAPCVMVANGPDVAVKALRDAVARGGTVIGVDGGARCLRSLGLRPHIVTGDFDSLSEDERGLLAGFGARIVPTPDQDYTDLDKALAYAVTTLEAREILLFGATGGRLDHLFSVLSALIKYGRRAEVRLIGTHGETALVNGVFRRSGADLPGRVLSLLAMGPVDGITMRGVRWPLTEESLAPGVRDGTSNEITAETVEITARSGDLLVFISHDDRRAQP